jgi:hypothetical protein
MGDLEMGTKIELAWLNETGRAFPKEVLLFVVVVVVVVVRGRVMLAEED